MEQAIQGADQNVADKEAAFAKAIRDARARGLKEKEAMIQAAAAEERKRIEGINAKAQADLEEMRGKIRADAERARDALKQEIGVFAEQITQKILGRAL
jgi:F-type H+-transporting ATPase subunit b